MASIDPATFQKITDFVATHGSPQFYNDESGAVFIYATTSKDFDPETKLHQFYNGGFNLKTSKALIAEAKSRGMGVYYFHTYVDNRSESKFTTFIVR